MVAAKRRRAKAKRKGNRARRDRDIDLWELEDDLLAPQHGLGDWGEGLYEVDLSKLLDGVVPAIQGEGVISVSTGLAEEMGFRESFSISLRYRITRKGDTTVVLELTSEAEVPLICDRCLSPFEKRVELSVKEEFLSADDYLSMYSFKGTRELGVDDLNTFYYIDRKLDLGKVALEHLTLSLPTKRLCRDDCKGLCPICGANLNEGLCIHFRQENTDERGERDVRQG